MERHPEAPALPANDRSRERIAIVTLVLLLIGLPLAVWTDTKNLTAAALQRQATDVNKVITNIRGYYSNNIVGRVQAKQGNGIQLSHNYEAIPGAIPIPATLSLELGKVIGDGNTNISYRFFSDVPFANRTRTRSTNSSATPCRSCASILIITRWSNRRRPAGTAIPG